MKSKKSQEIHLSLPGHDKDLHKKVRWTPAEGQYVWRDILVGIEINEKDKNSEICRAFIQKTPRRYRVFCYQGQGVKDTSVLVDTWQQAYRRVMKHLHKIDKYLNRRQGYLTLPSEEEVFRPHEGDLVVITKPDEKLFGSLAIVELTEPRCNGKYQVLICGPDPIFYVLSPGEFEVIDHFDWYPVTVRGTGESSPKIPEPKFHVGDKVVFVCTLKKELQQQYPFGHENHHRYQRLTCSEPGYIDHYTVSEDPSKPHMYTVCWREKPKFPMVYPEHELALYPENETLRCDCLAPKPCKHMWAVENMDPSKPVHLIQTVDNSGSADLSTFDRAGLGTVGDLKKYLQGLKDDLKINPPIRADYQPGRLDIRLRY